MNKRNFLAATLSAPLTANSFGFLSRGVGVQTEYFDAQFYANHNPDLLVAGLKTYSQLRSHWITHGIAEGRFAHPEFHAFAYKARYIDLQNAFGNNLSSYYWHYVTNGQYEGRNAKPSNLLVARLGDVSIGASPRCAGAVDSLVFGGKECINSYDHGRQLQTAAYDTRYEGCYNPTQAGNKIDGLGAISSSQLIYGTAVGNTLETKTRCAFWTPPGGSVSEQGMYPCLAQNTTVLSDFYATTKYTLFSRNNVVIIDYRVDWLIGKTIPAGKFMSELTTGYHTADFATGYEIVPENGYAARLRHMGDHISQVGQERPYPVLLTTATGDRAVGAFSRPVANSRTRYATWLWRFGQNQQTNDCSKWTIVRRFEDEILAGTVVSADCTIVLGQVTDVHLELARLMRY